jgi:hypothetical protein
VSAREMSFVGRLWLVIALAFLIGGTFYEERLFWWAPAFAVIGQVWIVAGWVVASIKGVRR